MDLTPIFQFLSPYVNPAALPMLGALIAGIVQLFKMYLKVDLGKFQWVVGIVLYGIYTVLTKGYEGHVWYEVIFVIIATGLCASGIFTVIKKAFGGATQ